MKIVLVNKSDATGGAAVVTFRLMQALRSIGVDARMIVAEKRTDSPYVALAASPRRLKFSFLAERLKIFIANGFNRSTLFKIDTASDGVDISRHPWVKEADMVCLNWVNQGLLSLRDIRRLVKSGKRIVWTMHDMWCMTGICHHAATCRRFLKGGECGDCPLMGRLASPHDMSHRIFKRKKRLYAESEITFVGVSRWLKERADASELLGGERVEVIPNAFPIDEMTPPERKSHEGTRILFGAARLDDPIKGWPLLMRTLKRFAEKRPDLAAKSTLVTFGDIRDASLLERIPIASEHLGRIPMDQIPEVYSGCDIVISTSDYETLPGTLVEGQAYGCIPVATDSGGQRDIIDHRLTGWLAATNNSDKTESTECSEISDRLSDGLIWAAEMKPEEREETIARMQASVRSRFSPAAIARRYLSLMFRMASFQTRPTEYRSNFHKFS